METSFFDYKIENQNHFSIEKTFFLANILEQFTLGHQKSKLIFICFDQFYNSLIKKDFVQKKKAKILIFVDTFQL